MRRAATVVNDLSAATSYDGETTPGIMWCPSLPLGVAGMDSGAARLDTDQAAAALSERDRRILEFERQWWKYAGAKEQAIRDLFEMSSTRYYQILNGLIDTPAALVFDPMLVKRLRRMRAARQRVRSARRLGIDLDAR
jgi:hypothetical protein